MRKRCVASALGAAVVLTSAFSAKANVIFSEDFESGLTNWTSNAGTGSTSAPPTAPPDAPSSTASFVDADGATTRIGRGFSTNAAATSFRLTYYFYTSTASSSTQRYYGQLSSGTAAAPGTTGGAFSRIAANNNTKYQFLYSDNGTQTVTTATSLAAGWHLGIITVVPGATGVGSYTYQIDNGTPVTITAGTNAVVKPTNVQLGNTVSNGTGLLPIS